jgi:ABC-type transport system involved in cytochrome bd biosynthesis fused ATPase/permease subunit
MHALRSEREVQAALDQLVLGSRGAGRTTIMIAHRLTTVVNVDRIVVLRKGRVLESGTPTELTRNGAALRHWQRRVALVGTSTLIACRVCVCSCELLREDAADAEPAAGGGG